MSKKKKDIVNNKIFDFKDLNKLRIANEWMKNGYGIDISREMGNIEKELSSYLEDLKEAGLSLDHLYYKFYKEAYMFESLEHFKDGRKVLKLFQIENDKILAESLNDHETNMYLQEQEENSNLQEQGENSNLQEQDENSNLQEQDENSNLQEQDENNDLQEQEKSSNLQEQEKSSNLQEQEENNNLKIISQDFKNLSTSKINKLLKESRNYLVSKNNKQNKKRRKKRKKKKK